jgi:hypothetical protein
LKFFPVGKSEIAVGFCMGYLPYYRDSNNKQQNNTLRMIVWSAIIQLRPQFSSQISKTANPQT